MTPTPQENTMSVEVTQADVDFFEILFGHAPCQFVPFDKTRLQEIAAFRISHHLNKITIENCEITTREGDPWISDLMAGKPVKLQGYQIRPAEIASQVKVTESESQALHSALLASTDELVKQPYTLRQPSQEVLERVAYKVGRILNGDPSYADSWVDIVGYTQLVVDRLERGQNAAGHVNQPHQTENGN